MMPAMKDANGSLEDSQSSNPGTIPGSATNSPAIIYATSGRRLLHQQAHLLISPLDRLPDSRQVRGIVDARGMDRLIPHCKGSKTAP